MFEARAKDKDTMFSIRVAKVHGMTARFEDIFNTCFKVL